eukprot:gene12689-6583_t
MKVFTVFALFFLITFVSSVPIRCAEVTIDEPLTLDDPSLLSEDPCKQTDVCYTTCPCGKVVYFGNLFSVASNSQQKELLETQFVNNCIMKDDERNLNVGWLHLRLRELITATPLFHQLPLLKKKVKSGYRSFKTAITSSNNDALKYLIESTNFLFLFKRMCEKTGLAKDSNAIKQKLSKLFEPGTNEVIDEYSKFPIIHKYLQELLIKITSEKNRIPASSKVYVDQILNKLKDELIAKVINEKDNEFLCECDTFIQGKEMKKIFAPYKSIIKDHCNEVCKVNSLEEIDEEYEEE